MAELKRLIAILSRMNNSSASRPSTARLVSGKRWFYPGRRLRMAPPYQDEENASLDNICDLPFGTRLATTWLYNDGHAH